MKTLIFALITILIGTTNIEAQSSFTLQTGLNLSNVKFSGVDFNRPIARSGYFIGLRHQTEFSENLKFNTELQYSQDGFRIIPEDIIDTRYHFLRLIPQIEFNLNQLVGFFGGLNFGINFKEETRLYSGDWFKTPDFNNNFINEFDLGLVLGARYYLKKFSFSFSYNHGFVTSTKFSHTNQQEQTIGDTFGRNRSIQVGLGYTFIKIRT